VRGLWKRQAPARWRTWLRIGIPPCRPERGKAAGVKRWIVKPFKGSAVLEAFKKLVA
jgi:hypothetical protein